MFVENSFKIDLVAGIQQLGTDIQKTLTNLFGLKIKRIISMSVLVKMELIKKLFQKSFSCTYND